MSDPVWQGIGWGLALAIAQSGLSIATLRWAGKRPVFYWVWGGGIAARFVVFLVTAFIVLRYTRLNLIAVLVTLVLATTVFLVFEASVFKDRKR